MATGACGINCSVCRLYLRGRCGSCGPAQGELADLKIKTQERILGAPCPLLACARLNRINHCIGDCDQFPCENFAAGPYPFSQAYLSMQYRRREEMLAMDRHQESLQLPQEHWQSLRERDPQLLRDLCGPGIGSPGRESTDQGWLQLPVLDRTVRINPQHETIEEQHQQSWRPAAPLVGQVAVFYLVQAERTGLSGTWLPEHDLACRSFFKGIHALPVDRILERYGKKCEPFRSRALRLGGTITNDHGDAAVRFWMLPQVPVKLILWCGDDELPASLTVLFDGIIEKVLAADGIWTMVRLLAERMLADD